MTAARRKRRSFFRLAWLSVVLGLLFGAMGTRLFVVQILHAKAYARMAESQRTRRIEFPARRGAIFDRNGDALAISVDLQTVFSDPAHVEDADRAAARLARILGLPVDEVALKLRGRVEGSRFEYIARQVRPEIARKIRKANLPGVYMRPEAKRYYPGGTLASHLLGSTDTDGNGIAGVEAQFDDVLRGEPGVQVIEQDPAGRALPQAGSSYTEPRRGRSLFLTIDKQIQYFAEITLQDAVRRYHAEGGTAVLLRAGTGEVLAMANVPEFDPNRPGEFSSEALRNRAVSDVYEPGSAYKIVTAAAALEEKVVSPSTSFVVPDTFPYLDRVFHDSHPHPTESMTVTEIVEQSSNVGMIKIALELGADRLDRYVRSFGFGSETGLDFPGESPGIVLDRDEWSGTTIATVPIGQGIASTALQMAAAYGAIANDGRWVEPKLVAGTLDWAGNLTAASRAASRRVVSRRTARALTGILEGVVENGTGIEAQIPGYRVAGKTGTAQKPVATGGYGNSYVASFAGFAPLPDPEIIAIVVLDDPSPIWGGSTAAPTFRKITEFALRKLGLAPSTNPARSAREIAADRAGDTSIHD